MKKIKYDGEGLVPVVVQHEKTGMVLMLAFMNREALARTLATGWVTFWSRSRQEIWVKGSTSGNYLVLRDPKNVRINCNHDSLLILAAPCGPTCHTRGESCYLRSDGKPRCLIAEWPRE